MKVTMTVKCVVCGKKREIKAGEFGKDDFPMCDVDGMPMLPEKAQAKKVKRRG